MDAPLRQLDRSGRLTAAFGPDVLVLPRFDDIEQLNDLFEYRVEALATQSDLDLARRQIERAGISFHFRHAAGSHNLVLTDDVLAHDSLGERPFKNYEGHRQYDQEHFWDWAPERNITTGAVRLTDYNFKKPMQAMEVDRLGDAAYAQGKIESFD